MKNIITIQHTQSIHHTNGMIGSWTDWDLTELGKQQAKNIGNNLISLVDGKDFSMYASDLKRAKQTALPIAEALGIKPIFTEALRERNLGEAVGKSVEWAHQNTKVLEKTVDDRAFDGAESRRDTWNRLLPFINDIMNDGKENVMIVSHGDTLSIFNAIWIGLHVEDLNRCDLFGQAGGVSFLHTNTDGKRIIRRLSDMSFIKP